MSIVSEETIFKVKSLVEKGYTQADIAKAVGLEVYQVGYIVNNKLPAEKPEDIPPVFKAAPGSLSLKVLSRFMNQDQLEELLKGYGANKRSLYSTDRKDNLSREITEEEKQLLEFYIKETETPIGVYSKQHGMSSGSLLGKAYKVAMRVIYQNQDILDKI